jgi:hypothetical protein
VSAKDKVATSTTWDEPVGLELFVRKGSYSGEGRYVVETGRFATAIRAEKEVEVWRSVTRLVNLTIATRVHGRMPFVLV